MNRKTENHHEIGLSRGAERTSLLTALIMTTVIMVLEFVGGWLSNSIALMSDAGHMLTDALALALSFFAILFASRPATARKTYGYYRLEILAALLNGVLLTIIAMGIFYESYERMVSPRLINVPLLVAIASIGFVANAIALAILSKRRENLNIRGAFFHVLGDTLSSIGVIIGGGIIALTGWQKIDPIIGMIIGTVIVYGSIRLIKESVDILLEAIPSGIELMDVSDAIESIEGIKEVHDLHVWCITTGMVALSGHIVVRKESFNRCDQILNTARRTLRDKFQIEHVTIQIESEDYGRCEGIC
ncbi:MAG: cation diffusion facilitator family transporter [Acidobacteriota bacterium]